jgi:hypothetical protein
MSKVFPAMKKIFLLSAILFTLQCFGQQPKYDYKKNKEILNRGMHLPLNKNKHDRIIPEDSVSRFFKKYDLETIGGLSFLHSNGNKVYALPQDNMPCLVPDLSRTNYRMPVLMNGIKITGMPPGSQIPVPIIHNEK